MGHKELVDVSLYKFSKRHGDVPMYTLSLHSTEMDSFAESTSLKLKTNPVEASNLGSDLLEGISRSLILATYRLISCSSGLTPPFIKSRYPWPDGKKRNTFNYRGTWTYMQQILRLKIDDSNIYIMLSGLSNETQQSTHPFSNPPVLV